MNAVKSSVNRVANLIINKITRRKLTCIINHRRCRCRCHICVIFTNCENVSPPSMGKKNREKEM